MAYAAWTNRSQNPKLPGLGKRFPASPKDTKTKMLGHHLVKFKEEFAEVAASGRLEPL